MLWNLWTFVEEVRKTPEKFVEEKILESQSNEDHLSDTGSWGTDFEDETNEENTLSETQRISGSNYESKSNQKVLENNADLKQKDIQTEKVSKQEEEETYVNCGLTIDENTYANCQETVPLKNASRLHNQGEKSLAEQLKEQLQFINTKKPIMGPKPELLQTKNVEVSVLNRTQPRKSFLHNTKTKSNNLTQTQKRMTVPPPPQPVKNKDQMVIIEKSNKDQTKPPATLRNLDLVANLPTKTEESEDEYESFDEQIIEQNQKKNMLRVDSKQSLTSGHQSSVESVYQPPSVTSYEEEEEHYDIYESITETPDDNGYYLNPIQRPANVKTPPPLPAKPPQSSATPSPTPSRTDIEKLKERSPEKKSATLPHSNSNTSLLSERATRPLPPPPERQSYIDKPWFHNVTREQATTLIKEQSTYGNSQDGYFLLRPSTTNVNNPLALVLWYRDRVYNVPVRKRPDNRYALGSAKVNEQSFSNVEEIVMFYTREELVLHSGGVEMGSTKLTDTPPK
ncbi:lymphocyte cytosolic protein 2 isoform X2 [Apis cerana]|uniref:lymphocyte cytosolic protein 2 isoform X2 n=1 Tax=Apis cerana TaxID=7461 RepID=UPI00109BD39A|nr:lymphocyte cytosolic protein 2 isoform X2 [Apis cerana]